MNPLLERMMQISENIDKASFEDKKAMTSEFIVMAQLELREADWPILNLLWLSMTRSGVKQQIRFVVSGGQLSALWTAKDEDTYARQLTKNLRAEQVKAGQRAVWKNRIAEIAQAHGNDAVPPTLLRRLEEAY